jgi:hypothetical protein
MWDGSAHHRAQSGLEKPAPGFCVFIGEAHKDGGEPTLDEGKAALLVRAAGSRP